jgi:hypothetical protein
MAKCLHKRTSRESKEGSKVNCEKCGQKQKMLLTSWYCDCKDVKVTSGVGMMEPGFTAKCKYITRPVTITRSEVPVEDWHFVCEDSRNSYLVIHNGKAVSVSAILMRIAHQIHPPHFEGTICQACEEWAKFHFRRYFKEKS